MRGRITALLTVGLLAIVAAGCGGGDTAATQVPGPPADVTIPESDTAPGAGSNSESSNSDNSTSSDSSSSDSSTSDSSTDSSSGDTGTGTTGDTGTGTTGDANGGTAAPDTGTDSASNDQAPPSGSDAQQFEDFCAQNPGAC
jgi:hypothetical protein